MILLRDALRSATALTVPIPPWLHRYAHSEMHSMRIVCFYILYMPVPIDRSLLQEYCHNAVLCAAEGKRETSFLRAAFRILREKFSIRPCLNTTQILQEVSGIRGQLTLCIQRISAPAIGLHMHSPQCACECQSPHPSLKWACAHIAGLCRKESSAAA